MQLIKHVRKRVHSGFEIQERCYQKSKTGVAVAPQKGLMSSKNILKIYLNYPHVPPILIRCSDGYSHCRIVEDVVVVGSCGEGVTVHGSDEEVGTHTRDAALYVTPPVRADLSDVIVPNLTAVV